MKLNELLSVLSYEQLVGIWNTDDKRKRQPTPQTYCKVKNLTYDKIRNILDYDILGVNVCKSNGGLLIRVFDRERLYRSVNNIDLARKIKEVTK